MTSKQHRGAGVACGLMVLILALGLVFPPRVESQTRTMVDVESTQTITGTKSLTAPVFLNSMRWPRVTALPGSPSAGDVVIVTDDSANGACDSAGGVGETLCQYNGAFWAPIGGGLFAEADTLQTVFARGDEITGANGQANCFKVGNGTVKWCIYYDSVAGLIIEPSSPADARQRIPIDYTGGFFDVEGDADILVIDPDAASINAMYLFTAGYRPLKSIYWDAGSITPDGTNCTAPTEQALNSSEKTWALSCADSNSSIMSGKIRMPKAWDGGTVTFILSLFHGTTETITFAGDFSAMCRRSGSTDVINSTYGTAVAADVSITTANEIEEATTTAVTPNGTCTGGSTWLLWRYVVDAANFSANAANSKVLGVTMQYSTSSLSD